MARRFINVIGRPRQVASARTLASIFLKPFDFQVRIYRRGETPLRHHAHIPALGSQIPPSLDLFCPTPPIRRPVRRSFRSFRRWGEVGYALRALSALHHRQFHEAGVVAGVEDLDRALLIVAWFGQQNVADVSLRITIVKGEPA